ncbi:MAG: penicillin-binding protein 2 [Blastocatellia bacterium]|nr:penicillin-binding protein 2 [Blastocatellia bacterium]
MTPAKRANFDPIEDLRRGGARLQVIYYLAIGIFMVLAGRLWFLQVMKSEVYAVQAEQNRTRILTIPARRGTVFDRKGKILVTSQASYNIVVSRPKDIRDFAAIAEVLITHLRLDREWLNRRFEAAKYEPKYESIVVKESATIADRAWVESHEYEYPTVRVEEAPRRVYPYGIKMAHALGYVGEVDKRELNDPESQFHKDKGFKLGDIVGKAGIERTYNDILMGKDGERTVVVDSRGRIQREVGRAEPIPGRDFYTTIDLDVQNMAEEQTDTMPAGRGVIVVADPNNGEILALVSHPAFDPNVFSLRSNTDEGRGEIRELYEDPDKPLFNRVIQGTYPPGSTWKLFTTVAALNEGVITPEESRIQDGGIQLGNYFMNSISNYGRPDVVTAIAKSADGYYYRLGLKMGVERFEKWLRIFKFGERTGVDLPREKVGTLPTRAFKEMITRNEIKRRKPEGEAWGEKDDEAVRRQARWSDYDMAASSFGQGFNTLTPIQLLRYVGGLAIGGQMHTPHLLLRVAPGRDRLGNEQGEIRYRDSSIYNVPMNPAIYDIVKKGMWQAVNAGGTAGAAAVEGFDVCGKTGTAQVISTEKATKKTQDHAWFMSFAPRDKPELSMVILTENAGFGGKQSAPRAKPIYEEYYKRTRGIKDDAPAAGSPVVAGTPAAAASPKPALVRPAAGAARTN